MAITGGTLEQLEDDMGEQHTAAALVLVTGNTRPALLFIYER
jgi:hypothetical protein